MSRLIKLLIAIAVVVILWKLFSSESEVDIEYDEI